MSAAEKLSAELVDAALAYADKGLPVFPCNASNKRPLTEHGFEDATSDPEQIRLWWARWPNAMIGMPTGERSGFWALDVDDPAAFENACSIDLRATRRCDTGKGYHLLFRFDQADPVSNAQRHPKRGWPFAELPGAEARGEGGYVIVPPSIHPSGKRYSWHDEATVAHAPAKLLAIVRGKRAASNDAGPAPGNGSDTPYGLAALQAECQNIRTAAEGAQEAALNEAALKIGALVAGGELTHTTARSQLIAAGLCMPSYDPRHPWTPENVMAKVDRSMADGARSPRTAPGGQSQPGATAREGMKTKSGDAAGGTGKAKPLEYEWAGNARPVIDGFWLIDQWLPQMGIAAIYGHPGSGKSFLAMHMAAHVACGQSWAGREVEQGLVVYVVAEGQTGFRNRLFAMQEAGELAKNAPFAIIPTPIDLQAESGDVDRLREAVERAVEESGHRLAIIVVDTLSKTFGAGKENTDDMVTYVNNCQRLASHFECLTTIVHHRPKDSESRDLRGHSSLRGNIDTAILVEAGRVKTATTLKQKDGEDNVQVRFELERVVIGVDRHGKEVSTCLTRIVDGERPAEHMPPAERARRKLRGNKLAAFRALDALIAKEGKEPPIDIPTDSIDRFRTFKAIGAGQARDRLIGEFFALREGDEDKKRDTAKRTANRTIADLKAAGVLGSWGDWFWLNC